MVGGAGPGQALFSRASLDRDPHRLGRPPLARQSSSLGNQSPLSFLSGKNFVALAIKNAHADRLRRPLYVRGGDDCRRRVRHFNLLLRQIRRAAVERSANKLNPERPRLFRDDLRRFAHWTMHARPAGDDQRDPTPVSRRFVPCGLPLPAARLRISLIAKLAHQLASDSAYSLHPFQAPKQPCKHIRALYSTPDRGSGRAP